MFEPSKNLRLTVVSISMTTDLLPAFKRPAALLLIMQNPCIIEGPRRGWRGICRATSQAPTRLPSNPGMPRIRQRQGPSAIVRGRCDHGPGEHGPEPPGATNATPGLPSRHRLRGDLDQDKVARTGSGCGTGRVMTQAVWGTGRRPGGRGAPCAGQDTWWPCPAPCQRWLGFALLYYTPDALKPKRRLPCSGRYLPQPRECA